MKTLNWTTRLSLATGALLALSGCGEPSEPQARGAARYETCVPCHGDAGEGRVDLDAPPIGGMPAWYVESQLTKFRAGWRGTHPADAPGMRMQPMSRTLPDDASVAEVSAHVATLPRPALQELKLGGNIQRGQALYGTCSACHALDGSGNEALKAPAIAGHPDWYTYSQLHNYKIGARGANPNDAQGALMRPMATMLDDQGMKDVSAYIWSMARK